MYPHVTSSRPGGRPQRDGQEIVANMQPGRPRLQRGPLTRGVG